jgi:polyphosphate kinase 2
VDPVAKSRTKNEPHLKKKSKSKTGSNESQVKEHRRRGGPPDSVEGQLTVPDHLPRPRMKNQEYLGELRRLHEELVSMQEWVKRTGAKVCIVFEGRDTAGKGGTIKAITERVSPRVFRVVALPAPTDREKTQMYLQRYMPHLPAGGEVVMFDRSWYNRAGVERVMGFCTPQEVERFLQLTPAAEEAMVSSGIILIKYWLEVSQEEQTRRLENRIHDRRKTWKLSDLDLQSYTRWHDYSRARDEMIEATHSQWAPWHLVLSDDKKRARLNVISHLLSVVPYEPAPPLKVKLPHRRPSNSYVEADHTLKFIAARY